jgi:hypothetical protein
LLEKKNQNILFPSFFIIRRACAIQEHYTHIEATIAKQINPNIPHE